MDKEQLGKEQLDKEQLGKEQMSQGAIVKGLLSRSNCRGAIVKEQLSWILLNYRISRAITLVLLNRKSRF
jgi:hypothetical protein